MTERNWLTVPELAARLEKSERTVRRWVANRQYIPFRRVGQQLRFEKADVDAYLARARTEPVESPDEF